MLLWEKKHWTHLFLGQLLLYRSNVTVVISLVYKLIFIKSSIQSICYIETQSRVASVLGQGALVSQQRDRGDTQNKVYQVKVFVILQHYHCPHLFLGKALSYSSNVTVMRSPAVW